MLIGICSASAVTAPKQNGISVETATTAVHSASGGQNSKEETVYVLANADGSVQKIIVSDWLKNPAGANFINDISELDGIENVKGDEAYTMNPNNMRVWDAKGQRYLLSGHHPGRLFRWMYPSPISWTAYFRRRLGRKAAE